MNNKPISEVIDDLKEVNCLLRDKVKCLESDLWDANQLRKVHSEKSFELERKVRELESRNNKDFAWRGQEIGRLNDELDIARERISSLEQQLATERSRVVKLPDIRIVRVAGQEIKMYHATTLRECLHRSGITVEGE